MTHTVTTNSNGSVNEVTFGMVFMSCLLPSQILDDGYKVFDVEDDGFYYVTEMGSVIDERWFHLKSGEVVFETTNPYEFQKETVRARMDHSSEMRERFQRDLTFSVLDPAFNFVRHADHDDGYCNLMLRYKPSKFFYLSDEKLEEMGNELKSLLEKKNGNGKNIV